MLRTVPEGVTLAVRAQPGARKTALAGLFGEGEQLKIAVQAPPVEGKANAAILAFLAKFFSLSRAKIELVQGELNRNKVFLLRGLTLDEAQKKIDEALR